MILATETAAAGSEFQWLGSVVVPVIVALLASGALTYFLQAHNANKDRRRHGYAEAVAGVVGWIEYPFRVRRRTSDDPETLGSLVDQGHTLQERLAFSTSWVAADDADNYEAYSRLVQNVKAEVVPLVQDAWNSTPITQASEMNLNGWGTPQANTASKHVSEFLDTVKRHFR
jgi:hypothetical protein